MSTRTVPVVVEIRIKTVIYVPDNWPSVWGGNATLADCVEFHLNESSHCAGNELRDLATRLVERGDECPCNQMQASFVRVATPEDVETYHAKKST